MRFILVISLLAMLSIVIQDIKNTPIDSNKQLVIVKMLARK